MREQLIVHAPIFLYRNLIWSHKFQDSILDIVGTELGKIIVGLGNGTISLFKVEYHTQARYFVLTAIAGPYFIA